MKQPSKNDVELIRYRTRLACIDDRLTGLENGLSPSDFKSDEAFEFYSHNIDAIRNQIWAAKNIQGTC